ncbi:efflux transporter outer membrane subunit [Niabella pedocola]|uniref:Efflux transporter outer membrane subunit n=1 Tax=Niabella pedocola TaxID=1752077 RepID=A0ABS8PPD1_9BACT|nr:efflux transporter outer membrane subunit [Niabella pedocola]MCD2421671.1 efflux transporter outer membrane subunit [Niabella pedocola]
MNSIKIYLIGTAAFAFAGITGCKVPAIVNHEVKTAPPPSFEASPADTLSSASVRWQDFFADPYLLKLVDTALHNNRELLSTLQEIEIARNDIRVKKGELLPSVMAKAGSGVEKVGRYTSQGAGDASTDIEPGKEIPDVLGDHELGLYATWEADIWKKLRNGKQAAVDRYLATVEGKNFVMTNLVAEIADSYYELLALDNQLAIVKESIQLQKNGLEIVKVQKEAARATELAVKKFEAEVLNSQSREYEILQQIKEGENKINFLLGRNPQPVERSSGGFLTALPRQVSTGIPSQLLANRPDIRQAELALAAARLDVKVARAAFYPTLDISAAIGLQAFKPSYLAKLPESVLFSLAGELAGPLINKNAIKAEFASADARQQQALYAYEKTILNAVREVSNELSNISNLEQKYQLKNNEVNALGRSIAVSNELYKAARADYLEVLMTQRDALESRLELVETREQQFSAVTHIYRALGGGWK